MDGAAVGPHPEPTAYPEEGNFWSAIYERGANRALCPVPQLCPLCVSRVLAERTWCTAGGRLRSATIIIIIAVTVSATCRVLGYDVISTKSYYYPHCKDGEKLSGDLHSGL